MKNEILIVSQRPIEELVDDPAFQFIANIQENIARYDSRMRGLRTARGIARARELRAKKVDDSMRGLIINMKTYEKNQHQEDRRSHLRARQQRGAGKRNIP